MEFNFNKGFCFIMIVIAWILFTFFFVSCSSIDQVQEKEGWFPVGMDEDNQSFYNSKYNLIDNGQKDPNAKLKIYGVQY